MLEEIKKCLYFCSQLPSVPPYCCVASSYLTHLLEKIKNLPYKEFLSVFDYAKTLKLPENFKNALKEERLIRNDNTK